MRESFYLTVLACLLASVVGCETAQTAHDIDTSWEQPRSSMVLDSPQMQLNSQVADSRDGRKWYDSRNDQTLSTTAGYRREVITDTVTRTTDRQYQHGNHVHDHYRSSTYRTRRTTVVR